MEYLVLGLRDAPKVVCLALVLFSFIAQNTVVSQDPPIPELDDQCFLDDDFTTPELERCLLTGSQFLDRYLNSIRRGFQFDMCLEFSEFKNCLQPLMERCPVIQEMHSHWRMIYDVIDCSCNGTSETCQERLTCFENQYSGSLAKRCDAYYKFNLAQRTREKCSFLEENIRCKERLFSSACGTHTGTFAFHVFRLSSKKRVRKRGCPVEMDYSYDGFEYSEDCPADFPETIEKCRASFLEDNTLHFHDENDLVAAADKRALKNACRAYHDYRQCVRPIKKACKKGLNLVYDYDGRLRTYAMKMDYICGQSKKEYSHHMPCYRSVLKKGNLSRCDYTWNLLQPMLERVTAHDFYCRKRNINSEQLQRVLDDLRQCYEDVFSDVCGNHGGKIIGGLMNNVFQDPFYLRYDYKPDCKLHKRPVSPHRGNIRHRHYHYNHEERTTGDIQVVPSARPQLTSPSSASSIVDCSSRTWVSLLLCALLYFLHLT